jgi:ferredoxin
MVNIKVDSEKCIGCGACAATCPRSFEMFEGKAREKVKEVKKITCEQDAADNCPVNAITITK